MLCVSVESMWEEQRRRLISQDASNTLSDAWWTSVLQNISMHSIVIFQSYPFQTLVWNGYGKENQHCEETISTVFTSLQFWNILFDFGSLNVLVSLVKGYLLTNMHDPDGKCTIPDGKCTIPDGRCTIPTEDAPSRRTMHHPDGKCTTPTENAPPKPPTSKSSPVT